MSASTPPPTGSGAPDPRTVPPNAGRLEPDDPPRLGQYWLSGRLGSNAAGIVYRGVRDDGVEATVVMMSDGAYADAAARERFGLAVESLPSGSVAARNSADDDDQTSWVALQDGDIGSDRGEHRHEGGSDSEQSECERPPAEPDEDRAAQILDGVLLSRIPQIGRRRGPDFVPHYERRRRPGLFRLWPLPWPSSLRAASRAALVWALGAMVLLMALLIFVAWLLWHNQPPEVPPPPIPSTVTSTGPQSPSPSTPQSPSPSSPGQSPTPSQSPRSPNGSPSVTLTPGQEPSDVA